MRRPSGPMTAMLISVSVWGAQVPEAKTFTNSVGMEMVCIEAGRFLMGSEDGEWDERHVHEVSSSRMDG